MYYQRTLPSSGFRLLLSFNERDRSVLYFYFRSSYWSAYLLRVSDLPNYNLNLVRRNAKFAFRFDVPGISYSFLCKSPNFFDLELGWPGRPLYTIYGCRYKHYRPKVNVILGLHEKSKGSHVSSFPRCQRFAVACFTFLYFGPRTSNKLIDY